MLAAERPILPAAVRFDEAALQTGDRLSPMLLDIEQWVKNSAYEIRIRAGRPVVIITASGQYIPDRSQSLSRADMNEIFSRLCSNAVYSHQNEIAEGCITLVGGHRAGLCGRAVRDRNGTIAVADISSICIRIAHEVIGCAENIAEVFNNLQSGLIIAGPPCSGKTTLLRDLVRILAGHSNVAVIDERGEIAAVYKGVPQLDVGLGTDVITGQAKADGMMHAVRCLSPDLVACDEIGTPKEAFAVLQAVNTGAKAIVTMHCGSAQELITRRQFCILRESKAFGLVALLSGERPGERISLLDIDEL